MKYMSELKTQFDKAMFNIYHRAREKCDYNAVRFLQMLSEKGGLATAKHLLFPGNPQEGFTHLWECSCLDLTVEALVLQNQYQELFSDEELGEARRRLEVLEYFK
jgi:PHP family Zn ribbon phosphoesterase